MEIICKKIPAGALVPADGVAAEELAKVPVGQHLRVKVTKLRNPKFHRKWFALAKYAFDLWSDRVPRTRWRGHEVRAEFDRFRRELLIMAGFFRPVWSITGEMRLEAVSISWSNMDDIEFEQTYSAIINVVLEKVLTDMRLSEAQIREYVEGVLAFD